MNSPDSLDNLMEQSIQDFRKEPAFFRALLDATVYAHAPLNDASERLRLVMFKSPDDGELVVPVFTDESKAEFAARGNVRIVSLIGRTLFEITRGAILMLNPNDARCTLYPEEISELLASGTIAPSMPCSASQWPCSTGDSECVTGQPMTPASFAFPVMLMTPTRLPCATGPTPATAAG